MASSRDRQRALARAKLERQMARRAAEARRRRQIQAGIGAAVALTLVILGGFWVVQEFTAEPKKKNDKKSETSASKTPGPCKYKDVPKKQRKANKHLKDVGKPKSGDEVRKGFRVLTLATNRGDIVIELDAKKAPCNTQNLAYLTGKKFYDGSSCHRLTNQGIYVLQCGDPSGTGQGGPTYTVNDENLPINEKPAYPKGVVAMANTGQADTASSQFFIIYKDTELPPKYTIVGEVTEGLDIIEKVAKAGHDGSMDKTAGGGKPKKSVKIKTATISAPQTEGSKAS